MDQRMKLGAKNQPDTRNPPENLDDLRCSFCYKSQADVGKLISSPSGRPFRAYICDECIEVCHSILEEDSR